MSRSHRGDVGASTESRLIDCWIDGSLGDNVNDVNNIMGDNMMFCPNLLRKGLSKIKAAKAANFQVII